MDANDPQVTNGGRAPIAAAPVATAARSGVGRRVSAKLRSLGPVTIVLASMFGALVGLGAFTFGYGKGASYLSSDPKGCVNCHVMQDQFDAWQHSSHHRVAVCNDCHLPHNFVGKWMTKADNGFFHSLAFTLGNFHDPIQIKPRNRRVTQGTCLHCHESVVHQMLPEDPRGEMLACVHCHRDVGHAQR